MSFRPITKEEALAIHSAVVTRFGGIDGVRDEVDPKSWTVENEIETGRKHSEEKLFRVLFCLGK